MDKVTFKKLFLTKIDEAIYKAECIYGNKLPKDLSIELHGAGVKGKLVSLDEAVNYMFIDKNTFYRIIDIGIKFKKEYMIFVRISNYSPSSFKDTWNSPEGSGPFKVIEPTP